jgi:hypothetical protein
MNLFRDAGHLLRFAALFVIAFLIFWAIRGFVVPKSFGQYGHYRAAAITEIAAHQARYAGHDVCETCHSEIVAAKDKGKHEQVNCEACHGPLAAHAADPTVTPAKLNTADVCRYCHAASAARPKTFPQVTVDEHSNGVPCETCHQPHSPTLADSTTAAAAPAAAAPAAVAGGAK